MTPSSRSSEGASSLTSTPPTSLDGSVAGVDNDASKMPVSSTRKKRARSSVGTLNDDLSLDLASASSRAVSGATLVNGESSGSANVGKIEKLKKELDVDMVDWDVDETVEEASAGGKEQLRRRTSRRAQLGAGVSAVKKRACDLAEDAYEIVNFKGARWAVLKDPKATAVASRNTRAQSSESPKKKAKYVPTGRKFPGLALPGRKQEQEEEVEKQPAEPPKPTKEQPPQKLYQSKGLYAGQKRDMKLYLKEKKARGKVAATSIDDGPDRTILPLPMYGTLTRLTVNEEEAFANFKLPFDVLTALKKEEVPKNWSRLNRNRFIGDAQATWDIKDQKLYGPSYCNCKKKCSDDCMNRDMRYECNDDICRNGEDCGNRPFAELKWRYRNKNFSRLRPGEKPEANLWGDGIETMNTMERGYGVRAMRSFEPDQIIVEYCGEIITQEEGDRRMNEDYKGKTDYYLMDFHDGMIIDATRGSICRFVNHSCDPNCKVEKWFVNGEPRMALFAGDKGVMAGEELTYDYNFEVFSKNSTQKCLCGSANCRGVLGPKPKPAPKDKLKQAAAAVKGALSGAKRKVQEVFGGDDSDDEPRTPKKKAKIDPKALLSKAKKQITSAVAPAVAAIDPSEAQLHREQRAQRARERATREAEAKTKAKSNGNAKQATKDMSNEFDEEEVLKDSTPKTKKTKRRRSVSTTIAVSDLPRTTSKASRRSTGTISASPAKKIAGLKDKVKAAATAPKPPIAVSEPRISSTTPLMVHPSISSNGSIRSLPTPTSIKSIIANSKAPIRQSKLSFGFGGFGFNLSPKKPKKARDDDDDEDENRGSAKKPKIPKRGSSLKAGSGVKKMVKTVGVGLKGADGIRKTVRAVSGAE